MRDTYLVYACGKSCKVTGPHNRAMIWGYI
jgi:hypothetical protein